MWGAVANGSIIDGCPIIAQSNDSPGVGQHQQQQLTVNFGQQHFVEH